MEEVCDVNKAESIYTVARCKKKFLQTEFWARFKAAHGWGFDTVCPSGSPLNHQTASNTTDSIHVLTRRFKKGPVHFTLAYVPMAPELPQIETPMAPVIASVAKQPIPSTMNFASALVDCAKRMTLPRDTLCVRFDAPLDFAACSDRDAFVRSLPGTVVKSRVDVQPPDTVLLDLVGADGKARSEDDLLAAMKSKWRYNIRLAQKKGVDITAYRKGGAGLADALDVFYSLYEDTARRDRIAIHPKAYYSDLLNMDTGDEGRVTLYVARHDGDDLAAIICVFTRDEATYLYGASANIKRNLMSTYLLQWTAIKDALAQGCVVYDFYGIPPTDSKDHPMAGLYLFKTGFGGREVHRPGSIDVPCSPLYVPYTAAERARAFWYKKVKKAHIWFDTPRLWRGTHQPRRAGR